MVAPPRLYYNLQKSFSVRVSVVGYLGIFAASVAAILATLLTKGRVWSGDLHFLPEFTRSGFNCNSTAIYPGQQFGGIAYNSTFTYVSQNSFAYSGQRLSTCMVDPGYNMQVIGPPTSWPAITVNYTVTCAVGENSNAIFSATTLNHGTLGNPVVNAVGAWNATVEAMEVVRQFECGTQQPLQAFLVDTSTSIILLFSQESNAICPVPLSNGNFTQLVNLAALYKQLIEEDFTSPTVHINPLPNLLYPCTKAEKVWAPTWTIVVECYTAVAATFGPSLLIVTWMLRKVTSADRTTGEEIAHELPARDVGLPPLQDYSTTVPLMKYGSDSQ